MRKETSVVNWTEPDPFVELLSEAFESQSVTVT